MKKNNNSLNASYSFYVEAPKKGYRCQKPLYKSIPEFVNLVTNHPELERDANFPSDESEEDFIPLSKLDAVDHTQAIFLKASSAAPAAQPAKPEPSEEKGGERSEPPADERGEV